MKKPLLLLLTLWAGIAQTSHAIPSEITYQGSLKRANLPANGTYSLLFRITNQDGTKVYWSNDGSTVTVTNGLFSARLSPSGVDWQNITPYIEITVEGQLLLPREPIRTTVYATLSDSVVDGAITTSKLNLEVQQYLVPPGAILMFAEKCPSFGWTVFSDLQGKFPVGADDGPNFSVGVTSGSLTHSHFIQNDGVHNHGGWTGQGDVPSISDAGANFGNQAGWHRHSILMDGNHNHGGSTGRASSLPPYLSVVFCRKN